MKRMSLRRRALYALVMSMAGATLGVYAVRAGLDGEWLEVVLAGLLSAALLAAAPLLLLTHAAVLPRWARDFQVVMGALTGEVRCVRCGSNLYPEQTIAVTFLSSVAARAHAHREQCPGKPPEPEPAGPSTAEWRVDL